MNLASQGTVERVNCRANRAGCHHTKLSVLLSSILARVYVRQEESWNRFNKIGPGTTVGNLNDHGGHKDVMLFSCDFGLGVSVCLITLQ